MPTLTTGLLLGLGIALGLVLAPPQHPHRGSPYGESMSDTIEVKLAEEGRWFESFSTELHVLSEPRPGMAGLPAVGINLGRREAILVMITDHTSPCPGVGLIEEIRGEPSDTAADFCEQVLRAAGRWGWSSEDLSAWVVVDDDKGQVKRVRAVLQVICGNPRPPVRRNVRGARGSIAWVCVYLNAAFKAEKAWVTLRCPGFIAFAQTFTGDRNHPGRDQFQVVRAALSTLLWAS